MQMPPTDAMRDKSESERRKEGRKEGRALSPEASALPGNHPSSHMYTQTHLQTLTLPHTNKSEKEKPTHRTESKELTTILPK